MKKILFTTTIISLLFRFCNFADSSGNSGNSIEDDNFGIWEIAYFVDDFGEPTKDGYIRTEIKGTFSNDWTQNSKLRVRFIIESAEIIYIKLYEEYDSSPKVLYDKTSYRVLVKDSKEEVHTLQAYHNHDKLFFPSVESKKLYNILLQGGTIKFNIVSSDLLSSKYNFTIDNADGFENAIIKLTGGSKIESDVSSSTKMDEKSTLSETRNDTQYITETCLVSILIEEYLSDEEGSGDYAYYIWKTAEQIEEMGIKEMDVEKPYLSFALFDGTQYVIDTKTAKDDPYGKGMLLYKKGYKPMYVHIAEPDMESIEKYLKLD